MENKSTWVILRDSKGGLELKSFENQKGENVIEEFDTFEEAKTAFNFYLYLLISKFGQNMNF